MSRRECLYTGARVVDIVIVVAVVVSATPGIAPVKVKGSGIGAWHFTHLHDATRVRRDGYIRERA